MVGWGGQWSEVSVVGRGGQWSEVSVVGRGGQWSEVSVCVAAGIPAVQTSPERGPSSSMDRGSSSSTQREHTSIRGGQTAACSLEPFPLTIPSLFVTLHSSLPPPPQVPSQGCPPCCILLSATLSRVLP